VQRRPESQVLTSQIAPSEEPEAYYLPRGNGRYEPTRATESPWDRRAQHGGHRLPFLLM
jgi:hypothetical protein